MLNFFGGLGLIGLAVIVAGCCGVLFSTPKKTRDRWYAVTGIGFILVIACVVGALFAGGVRLMFGP